MREAGILFEQRNASFELGIAIAIVNDGGRIDGVVVPLGEVSGCN